MTSQRVKNKKVQHETKSSGVTVVLYTLWRLLCYLFVLYNKNSNGLLKDFWGMKKEKQIKCDKDTLAVLDKFLVAFYVSNQVNYKSYFTSKLIRFWNRLKNSQQGLKHSTIA